MSLTGDPDGLLPDVDIRFFERQQLSAAHACVQQDEDGVYPGLALTSPEPIDLLTTDDLVRADRVVLPILRRGA